jgi:hypothetical protein
MEKTFEKKEIEDFRQKQLLILILKIYMKYLPEIQTELQVCPESIKSANIREFCRIRINLEDTYGHYIAENILYLRQRQVVLVITLNHHQFVYPGDLLI